MGLQKRPERLDVELVATIHDEVIVEPPSSQMRYEVMWSRP
jgi:hypothetical protein